MFAPSDGMAPQLHEALVSALSEASAPLDKLELVPLISTRLKTPTSAKEVNKALQFSASHALPEP